MVRRDQPNACSSVSRGRSKERRRRTSGRSRREHQREERLRGSQTVEGTARDSQRDVSLPPSEEREGGEHQSVDMPSAEVVAESSEVAPDDNCRIRGDHVQDSAARGSGQSMHGGDLSLSVNMDTPLPGISRMVKPLLPCTHQAEPPDEFVLAGRRDGKEREVSQGLLDALSCKQLLEVVVYDESGSRVGMAAGMIGPRPKHRKDGVDLLLQGPTVNYVAAYEVAKQLATEQGNLPVHLCALGREDCLKQQGTGVDRGERLHTDSFRVRKWEDLKEWYILKRLSMHPMYGSVARAHERMMTARRPDEITSEAVVKDVESSEGSRMAAISQSQSVEADEEESAEYGTKAPRQPNRERDDSPSPWSDREAALSQPSSGSHCELRREPVEKSARQPAPACHDRQRQRRGRTADTHLAGAGAVQSKHRARHVHDRETGLVKERIIQSPLFLEVLKRKLLGVTSEGPLKVRGTAGALMAVAAGQSDPRSYEAVSDAVLLEILRHQRKRSQSEEAKESRSSHRKRRRKRRKRSRRQGRPPSRGSGSSSTSGRESEWAVFRSPSSEEAGHGSRLQDLAARHPGRLLRVGLKAMQQLSLRPEVLGGGIQHELPAAVMEELIMVVQAATKANLSGRDRRRLQIYGTALNHWSRGRVAKLREVLDLNWRSTVSVWPAEQEKPVPETMPVRQDRELMVSHRGRDNLSQPGRHQAQSVRTPQGTASSSMRTGGKERPAQLGRPGRPCGVRLVPAASWRKTRRCTEEQRSSPRRVHLQGE